MGYGSFTQYSFPPNLYAHYSFARQYAVKVSHQDFYFRQFRHSPLRMPAAFRAQKIYYFFIVRLVEVFVVTSNGVELGVGNQYVYLIRHARQSLDSIY